MFAVIKTGGKQYRVEPQQAFQIEKIDGEPGKKIDLSEVLMIGENDKVKIGAPFIEGAVVQAEILEQKRGKKVIAFKKRRRKNSQRTRGHRQHLTVIRVLEIISGK